MSTNFGLILIVWFAKTINSQKVISLNSNCNSVTFSAYTLTDEDRNLIKRNIRTTLDLGLEHTTFVWTGSQGGPANVITPYALILTLTVLSGLAIIFFILVYFLWQRARSNPGLSRGLCVIGAVVMVGLAVLVVGHVTLLILTQDNLLDGYCVVAKSLQKLYDGPTSSQELSWIGLNKLPDKLAFLLGPIDLFSKNFSEFNQALAEKMEEDIASAFVKLTSATVGYRSKSQLSPDCNYTKPISAIQLPKQSTDIYVNQIYPLGLAVYFFKVAVNQSNSYFFNPSSSSSLTSATKVVTAIQDSKTGTQKVASDFSVYADAIQSTDYVEMPRLYFWLDIVVVFALGLVTLAMLFIYGLVVCGKMTKFEKLFKILLISAGILQLLMCFSLIVAFIFNVNLETSCSNLSHFLNGKFSSVFTAYNFSFQAETENFLTNCTKETPEGVFVTAAFGHNIKVDFKPLDDIQRFKETLGPLKLTDADAKTNYLHQTLEYHQNISDGNSPDFTNMKNYIDAVNNGVKSSCKFINQNVPLIFHLGKKIGDEYSFYNELKNETISKNCSNSEEVFNAINLNYEKVHKSFVKTVAEVETLKGSKQLGGVKSLYDSTFEAMKNINDKFFSTSTQNVSKMAVDYKQNVQSLQELSVCNAVRSYFLNSESALCYKTAEQFYVYLVFTAVLVTLSFLLNLMLAVGFLLRRKPPPPSTDLDANFAGQFGYLDDNAEHFVRQAEEAPFRENLAPVNVETISGYHNLNLNR